MDVGITLNQIEQLQNQLVTEVNDIFSRYDHPMFIPEDERDYICNRIAHINKLDDYATFLQRRGSAIS